MIRNALEEEWDNVCYLVRYNYVGSRITAGAIIRRNMVVNYSWCNYKEKHGSVNYSWGNYKEKHGSNNYSWCNYKEKQVSDNYNGAIL